MADASNTRNVLKLVRDLQRRKARERRELVILEGQRLVTDALAGGARLVAALAADDAGATALLDRARAAGADVETVPRRDFDTAADTETPSGVLAVAEWSPTPLERLPAPHSRAVALVLDAIQDPGNVGTMIRTAHALGAWCTIALDGTADVRGPKVLRAAMGSHFRHPVAEASFAEFADFAKARNLEILVAAANVVTTPPLPIPHSPFPLCLVIGSEGHGVRDAWQNLSTRPISIPMPGSAESLNAAVAAGILLYELTRVC
jgi:TrmH family RNA methyltransferase